MPNPFLLFSIPKSQNKFTVDLLVVSEPLQPAAFETLGIVNELHALAHRETLIPGKEVKEMNYPPKKSPGAVNR